MLNMTSAGEDIRFGSFFEEGKSFINPTAHVFYGPPLYLQADEEGGLKNYIRDNGWLVLFFRVDTDKELLVNTIRRKLNRTAQAKAAEEMVPGTLRCRISPLTMSESWFESSILGIRSPSFRNRAFVEKGEFPMLFHTSKAEAETL